MKIKNVGEGLVSSRYPKRKSIRLKNLDYAQANTVFFMTLCSLDKRKVFVRNDFNMEIVECIKKERERINNEVYVFCLMPEHLHVLSSPKESGVPITQFIGGLSSKITRLSWKYGFSGRLLQRSFYDHVIRKEEDLRKIAEYILNNPVRRGIVTTWKDYLYSGLIDSMPL